MDQRAQPNLYATLASKLLFSHQTVDPTVIIPCTLVEVFVYWIFLDPIHLKVSKWGIIPTADKRDKVTTREYVLHVFFLNLPTALKAPKFGDAGDVHPLM